MICTKYGPPDVLKLVDLEKPSPKSNEVLIRIHATTVTMGDCELRGLKLSALWRILARIGFGFRGPRKKVLGQELSGEIELVGKDARLFNKGDQVFAATGFALGGYAEYACLPERGAIALKPTNMSFEEAAAVPLGGLYSLPFVTKANLGNGQKVLINGAGGSIGTVAVQLAKSSGADVTAVDSSTKLDKLRSIGADKVIDYAKEDFTKSGESYNIIFDVIGKSSFSQCVGSLENDGVYISGNPGFSQMLKGKQAAGNKKVVSGSASYNTENLLLLKKFVEDGKMKSVIDRRYPLEQVADAHRYVETGAKVGNVVITIGESK